MSYRVGTGRRAKRGDVARLFAVKPDAEAHHLSNQPVWGKRVYAICFDLDQEALRTHYHVPSYQNAYADIQRVLESHGFGGQQGSVYFGNDQVTPVTCVLAIQDIARNCPWFSKAVIDVRMLRIEENNDLMPAVGDAQHQLELTPPPTVAAE